MLLLVTLLACAPDEPLQDTTDTAPAPFLGLDTVTWDGADGLTATWRPNPDHQSFTLVVTAPGGVQQMVFTDDTTAHVTGLADGIYRLSLIEAITAEPLNQLVGENRLVVLSQLELVGLQDLWGEGDVVVAAGGLHHDADVYVVDGSDPAAPTLLARIDGLHQIRDVHLEDQVLYAASDTDNTGGVGVWIYDLSDPSSPAQLATIPGAVHNLHLGEGHLYLADTGANAVRVFDVTDPAAPAELTPWPLPDGVHDITWTEDNLLYVSGPGGLTLLDVSDPAAPALVLAHQVGASNPVDSFHNVWPSEDGTHLFSTHEAIGGQMKVWQLGYGLLDPVGAWPEVEPNCVHNVTVRGPHVFASWYIEGVRVFDASEPSEPELIGWYDTFEEAAQQSGDKPDIRGAWGVWPYGDHVVVSDGQTGLWWFDFYPVTVTAGGS